MTTQKQKDVVNLKMSVKSAIRKRAFNIVSSTKEEKEIILQCLQELIDEVGGR